MQCNESDLPPIVQQWREQLIHPDIIAAVKLLGDKRRIDITLFSDRGSTPKPPRYTIT